MAETIVKIVVMKADGTTAEKTTELKFDGDTKDAVTMVEALEKGKKFHAHYVIDNGKIRSIAGFLDQVPAGAG